MPVSMHMAMYTGIQQLLGTATRHRKKQKRCMLLSIIREPLCPKPAQELFCAREAVQQTEREEALVLMPACNPASLAVKSWLHYVIIKLNLSLSMECIPETIAVVCVMRFCGTSVQRTYETRQESECSQTSE